MSWLRKTKVHHHLWMFAIIALGIILSTVILIFLLVNKVAEVAEPVLDLVTEVEANYQQEVVKLQALANSTAELDSSLLVAIEDKLLQMRVPADKREAHLQVFLKFFNEAENLNKPELLELLAGLAD